MKTFTSFAVLVVAAYAALAMLGSPPAVASHGVVSFTPVITNLAYHTSGQGIVLTWTYHSLPYKVLIHVTRTPAFPASSYPQGFAEFNPTNTFTDPDVKSGGTYTYTVCAFWVLTVNDAAHSHVNQQSCADRPITARMPYTAVRLQPLKIGQPTNVSATRDNQSTVTVSWTAPGGDDTAHYYLMSATAASAPPANLNAPGWGKDAAVNVSGPRTYNLSVKPAPSGQHDYFMVCAASSDDKASNCSTPVTETALPFAPAPH